MACLKIHPGIIKDLELMEVKLVVRGSKGYTSSLKIVPKLISWIKEAQNEDGELWFVLCVPDDSPLREAVLTEAHSSPFSIHPGSTKMYKDLKQNFWWNDMKHDVARFVAKCLTCQQVKIKHQRTSGLLQPLDILTRKWEKISMNFVTRLPHTFKKNNAIWVVVDRLTKSAYFLPIQQGYSVSKLAEIFHQEIIRLHGTNVVKWFWEVVKAFNKEDKARLLQFVTGTSKVPLEGLKALQGISGPQIFQIHKVYGAPERLPSELIHGYFNQLDLPEYTSKEQLQERLLLAIHEASEGFGFG
ncbi:retrotransposon protein, putative, ty3-gypsy subclass [Tanacetum coccineum]